MACADFDLFTEHFEYDWDTGRVLNRSTRSPNALIGNESGALNIEGYRHIWFNGKMYKTHRIVWLLTRGYWPVGEIDHIDGDRLNNKLSNLRDVSRRENTCNKKLNRDGRLFGCHYWKQVGKWCASIRVNKVHKYLGCYDTEAEAHNAYVQACSSLPA